MNKKILAVVLGMLVAASLLFAACGQKNGGAEAPKEEGGAAAEQAAASPAAADQALTFHYNGTEIALKANAAPILKALGEPKSYNEETSCAFEGLDKTYFYGSFYLYTYPNGDEDFVNMVELKDDTVETDEGLCIGDSKEKVEELYGADSFNGQNAYVKTTKDGTLTIIMDSDKVSSIQYAAVFE